MYGLIINGGSSSIKLALFKERKKVAWINYAFDQSFFVFKREKIKLCKQKVEALSELLAFIKKHFPDLAYVGHRIVHGGNQKKNPLLITPSVLKKIKSLAPLAPLHQPMECKAIECAKSLWPNCPSYAVFDTAFFHDLPETKKLYPLSIFFEKKGIKRYGFHGINHEYCVHEVLRALGTKKKLKIIVCHLGSGCSLSASLGRKCLDTTMGFTPLDGLMMGTRPGALDPGILMYLLKNKRIELKTLERHLLHETGLKGVSGFSSDYRELAKRQSKHPRAKLALEMFKEHLVKGILGMMGSLSGCDVLVFTGGMGQHNASLRQQVVKKLHFLKFKLDPQKNRNIHSFWVSDSRSSCKIAVIPAEEELFMAWLLGKKI